MPHVIDTLRRISLLAEACENSKPAPKTIQIAWFLVSAKLILLSSCLFFLKTKKNAINGHLIFCFATKSSLSLSGAKFSSSFLCWRRICSYLTYCSNAHLLTLGVTLWHCALTPDIEYLLTISSRFRASAHLQFCMDQLWYGILFVALVMFSCTLDCYPMP